MSMRTSLSRRANMELERLETGKRPPSLFPGKLQRTAARLLLGFFALMVAFTLVSRSADGIAIAKVQAEKTKSAILTNRTTLGGTIAPQADEGLKLPAGISVTEVLAYSGKQVKAGDALLKVDLESAQEALDLLRQQRSLAAIKLENAKNGVSSDSNSAVSQARQKLNQAQDDYDRLVASLDRAEGRETEDMAEYEQAVADAQKEYDKALVKAKEQLIKAAQDNVTAAEKNLAETGEAGDDAIAQAMMAYEDALKASDGSDMTAVERALQNLTKARIRWEQKGREAREALEEAQRELNKAKNQADLSEETLVASAQSALDSAQRSLKQAQRTAEDAIYTREEQLLNAQRTIDSARQALKEAQEQAEQKAQSGMVDDAQAGIDQLTYQSELRTIDEQIALLESIVEAGGVLVAPTSGTVQSITNEKGALASETQVVSISRADGGFVFESKVDQKTAKNLAAGDKGMLSYSMDGSKKSVEAVIQSISAADENGQVTVTARLPDGAYPGGASAEMTLTRRSEKYGTCLPLGALRNDSNGDYVLVLREKKNVMGTEQTLVRVPVEVIDKDSQTMAVQGALMYDDMVVTSANKPVREGDRVRVEGN